MDKWDLAKLADRRERLLAESTPEPWRPSNNPDSTVFPGLDTSASPQEQLDQLEQMITRGLQVCELSDIRDYIDRPRAWAAHRCKYGHD
jgi:hypothetical protein